METNRPTSRRATLVLIAGVAAALVATGIWTELRQSPSPVKSSTDPLTASTALSPATGASRVTARIELSARVMASGSSMSGTVVIENDARHALRFDGCGGLFAIALANDSYQPEVAWRDCLQRFTIPPGQSTYRVTIDATYLACGVQAPLKPCLKNGEPPLPPGDYHAQLYQVSPIAATPAPVTVHVSA